MADTNSKSPVDVHRDNRDPWSITLAIFAPFFVALFIPLHPDNPLLKFAQSSNTTNSLVFLAFFALVAIIIGVGTKLYKLNSESTPLEVQKKGAFIMGLCIGILFFASRLFFVS